MQTLIKTLVAAIIIVAVTETAKRIPRLGALILSLPLTSIIALTWLYVTDRDSAKVAALASSTLWFVLPSLLLFVALPWLLHRGVSFPVALLLSCFITAAAYAAWPAILQRCGIKF